MITEPVDTSTLLPLSEETIKRREYHVGVCERGYATWYEVNQSLSVLESENLWIYTHSDFGSFISDRLPKYRALSDETFRRKVLAVFDNLANCPNLTRMPGPPDDPVEVIETLAEYAPEEQADICVRALENCSDRPLKTPNIREAAREIRVEKALAPFLPPSEPIPGVKVSGSQIRAVMKTFTPSSLAAIEAQETSGLLNRPQSMLEKYLARLKNSAQADEFAPVKLIFVGGKRKQDCIYEAHFELAGVRFVSEIPFEIAVEDMRRG